MAIPDTEVLERAGLPSIESMVMKSYLYWAGHVVQIDDSHLPKQLFYGEICKGKRKALKSICKNLSKTIQHISGPMGKMALDRSQWHKLINVVIESFENNCIQYAAYKQSVCKGEQETAPGPQSH